ncbi:hypothetical protein [Janthinobacterium sp. HLX7-2]|uniref:hypothetical protein n=1 Tax=Janthinobacterium sp. HLX7-2 TaxID=1259331 RepID=UPI003F23AA1B
MPDKFFAPRMNAVLCSFVLIVTIDNLCEVTKRSYFMRAEFDAERAAIMQGRIPARLLAWQDA